jgi:hypothetical protein
LDLSPENSFAKELKAAYMSPGRLQRIDPDGQFFSGVSGLIENIDAAFFCTIAGRQWLAPSRGSIRQAADSLR